MPRRRASTNSGLSFGMAACVLTTTVGSAGQHVERRRVVTDPHLGAAGAKRSHAPRLLGVRPRDLLHRGPAGCGRCPTCPLPRCRPCAPAAVPAAARGGSSWPPRWFWRRDVERHLGDAVRGIAVTGQRGGGRHRRSAAGGPPSSTRDGLGDERRRQVGVGDQESAARADHRKRIEPLFSVADRQRNVHGGQARRPSPRRPSSRRTGRSPGRRRRRRGPSGSGRAPPRTAGRRRRAREGRARSSARGRAGPKCPRRQGLPRPRRRRD